MHVDKKLFGDTFRSPPRLTPLEARAIRLALEFVGPMIAADAHTPLERVRRKLEETFGAFELTQTPTPGGGSDEERLIATLQRGHPQPPPGEHRVPERGGGDAVHPRRGAVRAGAQAAALVRPHLGPHERGRAELPTRPHAQRLSHRRGVRAAGGFEPRELRDARRVRVWYSPVVARWRVERGDAGPLADGAALAETPVGSVEWLVGEIFFHRGEAVVLEPEDVRQRIAARAAVLAEELGRVRAPA